MSAVRQLSLEELEGFSKQKPQKIPISFSDLTPSEYFFSYIEPLLLRGQVVSKTHPMFARNLSQSIQIRTMDDTGNRETQMPLTSFLLRREKDGVVSWHEAYLLADPKEIDEPYNRALMAQHFHDPILRDAFFRTVNPNEAAKEALRRFNMLIADIGMKLTRNLISEADVSGGDYVGMNMWLNDGGKFNGSYRLRSEEGQGHIADPKRDDNGDLRIVLPVSSPINWIASWGKFPIAGGVRDIFGRSGDGAIAAYIRTVENGQERAPVLEIFEAYKAVKSGLVVLEGQGLKADELARQREALIIQNFFDVKPETGALSAKFDVYGMKRGFLNANYTPFDVVSDERVNSILTKMGRPSGRTLG